MRRDNRRLEELYYESILRNPTTRRAPERNSRKGKLYALGWCIFSLLGLYGYFSSPQRDGALALFLSDPAAAIQKYFVGDPAQSFAALLMWAAAYQAGAVIVFPEERQRHTLSAIALVVVSLVIAQIAS